MHPSASYHTGSYPTGNPTPEITKISTSLEERERLLSEPETRYTAFSPRPETRLAMQKSPTTSAKISFNHRYVSFALSEFVILI